jgi:hypothetical protein
MQLTPIGIIHTQHQQAAGTPIQAALATGGRFEDAEPNGL